MSENEKKAPETTEILRKIIEGDKARKTKQKKSSSVLNMPGNVILVGLAVIQTILLFALLPQGLIPSIFAIIMWLAFAIFVFAFGVTEVEPNEVMALKNLYGELRFLEQGFHFWLPGWEEEFKRISLKDEVWDPAQIKVITKDAMDITVDYKVTQRVARGEENYKKVCTVIDYEERKEVVDINLQAAVRDEFAKYPLAHIVYKESEGSSSEETTPEKTQELIEKNINEQLKTLIEGRYGIQCEMALLSISHGSEEAAEDVIRAQWEAKADVIRASGRAKAIQTKAEGVAEATQKIKKAGVSGNVAALLSSDNLGDNLLAALAVGAGLFRPSLRKTPKKEKTPKKDTEEGIEEDYYDEYDEDEEERKKKEEQEKEEEEGKEEKK